MTQDEILALAREIADKDKDDPVRNGLVTLTYAEMVRLANAVEAKVKTDLLAGAGKPVGGAYLCDACDTPFDSGHYCPSRECGHNTSTKQDVYTADQVAAAVLREREECAKVCVPMPGFKYSPNYLGGITQCAEAIRARGNKA